MNRLSAALLGLACALPAAAQSTGYGPLALTLPTSARTIGMGDVGVASRDDDVVFYNPAQLLVARGTSFSLTRLSETARGATMSTVLRLGPGGVGFGVNYLEYQVPPLVYPVRLGDVIPGNFDLGTSAMGVIGYGQTYRGFRVGASAKYAMDAIDLERHGDLYADAGLGRDFGRYSFGLAAQNLGSSLSRGSDKIKPPTTMTLGAATSRQLGPLDGAATAGVSWSQQDDVTAGGGIELGYSWITGYNVAFRAGAHSVGAGGNTRVMGGFGFTADRLTLDLAVDRLPNNRAGYRAGIRIR